MKPGGSVIVAGLAALALALPAAAQAGTEQADQRLDDRLRALVTMPDGPPGVSALVQRGKQLRFHTAGRAKVDSPGAFRIDDHMRIASVTKAFTGAVTLALVERGKLSLGDTIGKLRPEMPQSWHAITVRQLMAHTSGLPNYTATDAFQTYFPAHLADYISPAQVIGFAATEPLEFSPGAKYAYSNTGTIVLGLMAEKVTGRSYARNLNDLVVKPLGLSETTLPFTSPVIPKPFIRGYVFAGPGQPQENVSQVISPSGVWAAGGIISTPRDLNTFVRAWAGGDFLDKPAVRKAQTAFLPPFSGGEPIGPGQNRGGLNLYRYRLPCGVVFGHSGNFPGYTQWIAASPDGSRSAVVTANIQVNIPDVALPEVATSLRRVFRRAACTALAGS
jgi:D-alanyl-D-alanine carboxypeptidase